MVSGDVCVDMSGRLLAGSVGTGGTVGVLGAVDGSEHDGAGGVVGLSVVGTVVSTGPSVRSDGE